MSDNSQNDNNLNGKDLSAQIGETVRSALESGDLSRLKNLAPVLQTAAKDIQTKVGAEIQKSAQANPPKASGGGQVQQAQRVQVQPRPAWMGQNGVPAQWGKAPVPVRNYGTGSIVVGVLGTVSFGISALLTGLFSLVGAASSPTILGVAAGFAVPFGLSIALLASGVGRRKLSLRLRRYYEFFATKNVVTLVELSEATGRSVLGVRKDLRKGIAKKLVRDVRMDVGETCMIRGEEAYRQYLETEKNRLAREKEEEERKILLEDPKEATMESFKREGRAMIGKIKAANEALPGAEISEKLQAVEDNAAKIIKYVEGHPSKLPDTRKFMDYYLPTTLKLVEKYRYYEEQDVQVRSVKEARVEIEKALDNINVAFKNLLNSLYQEDTLDVSTDIKVLETMLAQEGLTGRQFKIDPVQPQ